MAPKTFPEIPGVQYESLDSIRRNSLARAQLAAVMEEQYSLCNLEFLDKLDALIKEQSTEMRLTLFLKLFNTYISEEAGDHMIMFGRAETGEFAAANAACQQDAASAASVVGVGTPFDDLLSRAKSHVENMCRTAMTTLTGRLLTVSPELDTP